MKKYFFISSLLFLLGSCSKEEVYSPQDMFFLAYNFDNSIEEVRLGQNDPTRSLKCSMYPDGCIEGSPKRFKIRLVEMIVVQYRTTHKACLAAVKMKQYYTRNWLFDDVTNEPVLESFVKTVYDAKAPKKIEDCN